MKAFDLRSWLTGFALGLSGKPLPLNTGKKLVGYSYNGTVLPKLPEWDKTVYPYAFLYSTADGGYGLCVTSSKWIKRTIATIDAISPNDSGNAIFYNCDGTQFTFSEEKEYSLMSTSIVASYYVWSSYDIMLGTTETVQFAASEPVPVYE